jgi:type I restriction enzyme, S subunit
MQPIPLKDIAEFIRTGKTPPTKDTQYFNGEIQWFTPGDLDKGKLLVKSTRTLTELAFSDKKAAQFPSDTLLVACIGDIGKLGITTHECSSNQQITGIKPKANVDVSYLYYWFTHNKVLIQNTANNAVVPILNNKTLEQIKVPLPPLAEQQKIAAILDAADSLRQKDQQLVERYTALSQSLFLEMFGDPVTNPKGWEKTSIENACSKVTDGTHDTPERLKEGVKFITGKHIRPYVIDYENSDYVSQDVHDEIFRRCNPSIGDVLYTNIGVNLGTAALNIVEYEFSMKNVALLKPKSNVLTGRFLEYYLNNNRIKDKIIWMTSVGGAQQFLSLSQLRKLEVLTPTMELQNRFAERIQLIEAQKQQAQRSLEKSEALFNSLLQRAFTGELTAKMAA